ncbi:MAG: TetR/AcrR family transcriptional regulator [Hamadaea sp.]|uniref:TetR/AcrR family transcriptional regulator n=1 Tax=Hamadaea sp. TaxID=2024425 RepID=UPI0017C2D9F0|nr:TetR/AcrR family transcriptional regulator [Hamadaea sp.]NUR69628.1 TetR/AcrR family transcriptional regulator [Hamadaea sp.]NUT23334.1 TetR/AcrR family transcriptional regulator [Hamadaea sp.]
MPRAGLTPSAIVELALGVVDEDGLPALTLTAVAKRAGVAVPALYKHIRNLDELVHLLRVRIIEDLTELLTTDCVGRSGPDALRALADTFRAYAVANPHRYALTVQAAPPNTREAEAAVRMLTVFLAVLRGFGLDGPNAIHAARALRAACHGFAAIQAAGGFGLAEDVDVSYDLLVRMVIQGLPLARELPTG